MKAKVMTEFYALGKNYVFKEVDELHGYTNFRDFEEDYDNDILYADMQMISVSNALLEKIDVDTDMTVLNMFNYSLELYLFDGWYIALK